MTPDATTGEDWSNRLMRVWAAVYAFGAIVFGALAVPQIVQQWSWYAWVWTTTALALFVVAISVGLASRIARPDVLRIGIGACATIYAIALASVVIGMPVPRLADDPTPWILDLTALGPVAAAIAWPGVFAWVYVAMLGPVVFAQRMLTEVAPDPIASLQHAVAVAVYSATLVALVLLFSRSATRLGEERRVARVSGDHAAVARFAEADQRRLDHFIHDDVLAVLTLIATPGRATDDVVRTQAGRTLELMRTGFDGLSPTSSVTDPREFAQTMRGVVAEIDADCEFLDRTTYWPALPPAVTLVLRSAIVEALRNSVTHAGGDSPRFVTRLVVVESLRDSIDILISDDGVGFHPDRVGRDRLGVAQSIVARVTSMDGGQARVRSIPGRGTHILLRWTSRA
jgi:signal transduction histidine kinase